MNAWRPNQKSYSKVFHQDRTEEMTALYLRNNEAHNAQNLAQAGWVSQTASDQVDQQMLCRDRIDVRALSREKAPTNKTMIRHKSAQTPRYWAFQSTIKSGRLGPS